MYDSSDNDSRTNSYDHEEYADFLSLNEHLLRAVRRLYVTSHNKDLLFEKDRLMVVTEALKKVGGAKAEMVLKELAYECEKTTGEVNIVLERAIHKVQQRERIARRLA